MFTRRQYTRFLPALLLGSVLFSACSRPTAYFQPSPREHFATVSPAPTAVTSEAPAAIPEPASTEAPPIEVLRPQPSTPTIAALNQVDALVSSDVKLATNKTVHKRLERIRNLLTLPVNKAMTNPARTAAPKKMNIVERLMLKKLNKKIDRQLAPNETHRTMANKQTLVIGAVCVLAAIVLFIISGGTFLNVLAVILGAVGLVSLILGLL